MSRSTSKQKLKEIAAAIVEAIPFPAGVSNLINPATSVSNLIDTYIDEKTAAQIIYTIKQKLGIKGNPNPRNRG